ncbi:hypothetical protein R0K05_03250 [Planococcus sp. SIMBA_160]
MSDHTVFLTFFIGIPLVVSIIFGVLIAQAIVAIGEYEGNKRK